MKGWVQFSDGRTIIVASGLTPERASGMCDELCQLLCIPLMGFTDTYVWSSA